MYEIPESRKIAMDDEVINWSVVWSDNNASKYKYPPVTINSAEAEIIGEKWTNIDTYSQEMIIKFIIGTEPLSRYDAFLSTLDKLGVKEVLRAKQDAYNRYQKK
jgi:putative aldouronate transport system substrate-binding protein